jgi:hypothetical protein
MFFPFSHITKKLSECNIKRFNNPIKKVKYKKGFVFDQDGKFASFDSGLEEKYFKKLNLANIKWKRNDYLSISYLNPEDNKIHQYFPDLFVYKNEKVYLQEVKPSFEIRNPVVQAKAKAAISFCEKNGWIFEFVTEKEIKK